ncbi:MAG: DNA methyltransferase [Bacteroidia bacterium]
MALSWNEIKDRAIKFSNEWKDDFNEDAEAKPFLEAFFNVFGLSRKKVATFEHRVKKLDKHDGYIDLLWKGTLLVEMKSKDKNLDKAFIQAKEYLQGLKQHELPKYILLSDFEKFRLYDLEDDAKIEFKLNEFVNHVQNFGFIAGYQKRTYKEQDPVNIEAAELMGKLHDKLKDVGYTGHPLEIYLVRLLFCLFADDTTIFDKDIFNDFIEQRTSEDGSDLAARLNELFYVLNTPKEKRLKNLDEQLAGFPYVNGKLFEEHLPPASFDSEMRNILLECCNLNWGKISPAIFGSMFQSVMNAEERKNLGAHYTSEQNILKLIKPLFLDDLWQEYESVKQNRKQLIEFHKKLSTLRFFDPACGCGNFLVITYRELRLLELELLKHLHNKQLATSIDQIIWIDVDQFFGIEYDEWPAQIAQVAMWLIDHQMNMMISEAFGEYFVRLPLKKSAVIVHGNALRLNWQDIISKDKLSYILGNPPFYGSRNQTKEQKEDTELVFDGVGNIGVLDYVACWYYKAAKYIKGTDISVAFVSTDSICQGIQVPVLWQVLLNNENININFAHQTFKWKNEAKGNAAVYCVIIGFSMKNVQRKKLYEYENVKSEALERIVSHINPYLLDSKDIFIEAKTNPILRVPPMMKGNAAIDDGNFLFSTEEEAKQFIKDNPKLKHLVKKFIGSDELINSFHRYCLWLKDASPIELKSSPEILERIDNIKKFRSASKKEATRKWAAYPTRFMEDRQPANDYLMIPVVSSENRKYIPIGFLTKDIIANYSSFILPNATLYEFGMISSMMHNVWIRNVCGKLEGRIRYSNTLGYNNFPWPENPNEKQKKAIETAAQKVLDARSESKQSTLADLYDPRLMPPSLTKAHIELDKAVDLSYRPQPFISDAKRMEFLFELYEKYTADLFSTEKVKKTKKEKK